MRKITPIKLLVTLSLLALENSSILAADKNSHVRDNHTIKVDELPKIQARQEIAQIKEALETIVRKAVKPYDDFANTALGSGLSTQEAARKALSTYNAHVLSHGMFTGSSSFSGSSVPLHHEDMASLLQNIKAQAELCTKRLRELEEEVAKATASGGSGGGANDALIAELREEIKRLGGNTRDVEGATLPSLNAHFIYVAGGGPKTSPQETKAKTVREELVKQIEVLKKEIEDKKVKFAKVIQSRKWASKLENTITILEDTPFDWDAFSGEAALIENQNAMTFGGGEIDKSNPAYKNVVDNIKALLDMRAELQATHSENEYETKQEHLQKQHALTVNLDTIADDFNNQVSPALLHLIGALGADKQLKTKFEKLLSFVHSQNLNELIKYNEENDKTYLMKNKDFIQQGIIKSGLAGNANWKIYSDTFGKYQAAIKALGDNGKVLILLHQMRHGKEVYNNTLAKVKSIKLDATLEKDAEQILKHPNAFDLVGKDRKTFIDSLQSLKVKYEKSTDPNAMLLMQLAYSYLLVFDAASELYFKENPPRRGK